MIVPVEVARRISAHQQTVIWRTGPKCVYKPGRCYALQTQRKRPAKLHVTIAAVVQAEAGELTLRDARRLGHRTTADLIAATPRWDPSERVWLLYFELGDQTDTP